MFSMCSKRHLTEDELDEEDRAELEEVKKVTVPAHIVEAVYSTVKNPVTAHIDFREEIINRLKDAVYFRNKLYLAFLGLTNKDVISFIVPFLKLYSDIPELNISNNYIGNEGVKALAVVDTLRKLKASGNEIGDAGAQILAKCKLKKLDISSNKIGDAGIAALARNDTIEVLNISFSENVTESTLDLFTLNNTLTCLDVRYIGKIGNCYKNDVIQKTLEHRRQLCYKQKIAVLMGTHHRLGSKSLIFTAFAGNKPLLQETLDYIKATPIELKDKYSSKKSRLS